MPEKFRAIQLHSFLPYQITVLADLIARRTAEIADRNGGLNLSQWRVMAAIAESPGRTAQDVVSVTPMDKAIVSRAVAALLDTGLLTRRASRTDGRLGHLFLTEDGQSRYSAIAVEVRRIERDFLKILTKDQKDRALSVIAALANSLKRDQL